jgi:imidazolonepropionase-like amidohydrolase
MSPMGAIIATTKNAAELLGSADDIGSVQTGRYADLVAVKGNPLQSPALLGQVAFVMKGGTIVRQNDCPPEWRNDGRSIVQNIN